MMILIDDDNDDDDTTLDLVVYLVIMSIYTGFCRSMASMFTQQRNLTVQEATSM